MQKIFIYGLLLCCFMGIANVMFAQTVKITVLQGAEVRCCTDSTVKVEITPNLNFQYTKITLNWGDGTPEVVILPGEPLIREHQYSTYDYCSMCKDYFCAISSGINGFCYNVSVFASYQGAPQENVSKVLTFKVKTQPAIAPTPNVPCVGDEVTFNANVCPSNAEGLTYMWTLPDGTMSTANQPTFTVQQAQTYQISLQVKEDQLVCGNSSTTLNFQALNKPEAVLAADSGANVVTPTAYKVCLDGGMAIVRLNAVISLNEVPPYIWTINNPPGANAQWFPLPAPAPTTGVTRLKLTTPGIYTIGVRVNNGCNEPDETTITIEVIAAPVLTLSPQRDSCVGISYSPVPKVTNAVYKINGVVQNTFPVNLPLSPTPYVIEGELSNDCGNQIVRDTFWLAPATPITITQPTTNLVVCKGSPAIALNASLPGIWTGANGLLNIMNGDTIFNPTTPGDYLLVISKGLGVCKMSDTAFIKVVDAVPLTINQPNNGCISLSYTPEPLLQGALYTINGTIVNAFPILLDTTPGVYKVVASLGNECGNVADSITVFIDRPVPVQILAPRDTIICSGTADLVLVASDTIGTWSGTGISNVGAQWLFSPSLSGTFPLIFARGIGECRRADTIFIKVEPANAVNAGLDIYLCNDVLSYDLPAGVPTTGTFSGTALNGNTLNIGQLTLDSVYTYLFTDISLPDACNDDELLLTVSAPVSPGFMLSTDTTCVGKTVNLQPTATGNLQFEVNWGDGTISDDFSHVYAQSGTYTISLKVNTIHPITAQPLCTSEATGGIHVIKPIQTNDVKFVMMPDTGCAVLTVQFTNQTQAENAKYFWDFGNQQFFNGPNPPAIAYQQGTEDTIYIVKLTVNNGCDSISFFDTVRVFPRPTAKMGISYLQPCSGAILTANVLSTGNPVKNTFYTSTGLVKEATLSQPTFFQFFTDSIPQTIGMWLVTANHCDTDTAYQEIIVQPTNVVALIGLPDTTRICVGVPITLLNYATSGAPFEWNISNGNSYAGDSIQVIFDQAGVFFISLKASGCGFDSISVPILVHPLPSLSVEHPLQRCPHQPVDFMVTSSASDIVLYFGVNSDSTVQKISQYIYPPGNYTPSVMATDIFGCVNEWSGALLILTPPIPTMNIPDSVCVKDPVLFTGISDQNPVACNWLFGDGDQSPACIATHAYSASGLFDVVLKVVSNEGCIGFDTGAVYVRSRPNADFLYDIKQKCTPALVEFTANTVGATGLFWQMGDGSTSTLAQFDHTYNQGQEWQVMLIATNEGICSDTVIKPVKVFQTPHFTYTQDIKCTQAEGVEINIITPFQNYVLMEGTNYSQVGNYHPGLPPDNYDIYIKTPEGCENDTIIVVLPVNELELELVQDSFFILLGNKVQIQALVNLNPVGFQWDKDAFLNNDTIPNPIAIPERPITYYLTATDVRGCTKTVSAYIYVTIDRDSSLFVPTAFSPNDDGVNDVFYVRNALNPSINRILECQIFDKWGEKVFDIQQLDGWENAKPEDPYWGWNGYFKGQKAETGAYRFQILLEYSDRVTRPFNGILFLAR